MKKQYIIHVLSVAAGVTFEADEEKRVRAEADRRGISVEELIVQAIRERASESRGDDTNALITRTVTELARSL